RAEAGRDAADRGSEGQPAAQLPCTFAGRGDLAAHTVETTPRLGPRANFEAYVQQLAQGAQRPEVVEREDDRDAPPADLEDQARREPRQVADVQQLWLELVEKPRSPHRGPGIAIGLEARHVPMPVVEGEEADAVASGLPQLVVRLAGVPFAIQHGDLVVAGEAPGQGRGIRLRAAQALRRIRVVHE